MNEVSEDILKQKWKATEGVIKSEIAQTLNIYEICKNITNENIDLDKKQPEEEVNRNKENMVVFQSNDYKEKKPKRVIQHFNGKLPFGQNMENEDPFDEFKKDENNNVAKDLNDIKMENRAPDMRHNKIKQNFNRQKENRERKVDRSDQKNNEENFVLMKKQVSNNNQEKKDPMVWDAPEEKQEKQERHANKSSFFIKFCRSKSFKSERPKF